MLHLEEAPIKDLPQIVNAVVNLFHDLLHIHLGEAGFRFGVVMVSSAAAGFTATAKVLLVRHIQHLVTLRVFATCALLLEMHDSTAIRGQACFIHLESVLKLTDADLVLKLT
jgi:hypothetical protein